jgi:predicted CXXCH cytochrome family protein
LTQGYPVETGNHQCHSNHCAAHGNLLREKGRADRKSVAR